jgi:nitroreductase
MMDIVDAIRSRKSIRGYKPDPVPEEVLREILDIAIRAPSGTNAQPWEITVITGEVLDNIKKGNIGMVNFGVTPHSEAPHIRFEGKYRQRQVDLALDIFKLMDITREDKEQRLQWAQRGHRFFDAPAAIILSMDKSLDESAMSFLDIGAIMQTICLAALKYGLGTCIEDQGVMFPEVVRKYTGISESKRLMIGIAVGYPDWDFPANKLETTREPVDSIVTWCSNP